jgi:hypothetical protein
MAEQDVWTGEEFASRIALDPALLALAKPEWDAQTETTTVKELRAKAAREIVRQSIRTTFGDQVALDDVQIKELARLIVEALPKEAMNGAIVQALDVRPYIQLVASEPNRYMSEEFKKDPPATPAGRVNYPRTFEPLAEAWQQVQEQEYRTTGNAYKQTNTAGVSPATATAQQATAELQGAEADPFNVGSQTVDLGGLESMVRTGKLDINDPNVETATFTMGNVPGVGSLGPGGGGRSIGRTTVGGALDWMFSLDEREVATMQSLLANAGYMTDMRYDAEGDRWIMRDLSYEDGYANDPVTRQAWQMAISDAFSQGNGKSMRDWLQTKTVEFKQREDALRTRLTEERVGSFNQALGDVRAVADRLAIETVGRRLNPEEFVQVRQYLRSLQSGRADDAAGAVLEPWMSSDPQRGFTEDELSSQVMKVVEPEMEQSAAMSANRQLKKWLDID